MLKIKKELNYRRGYTHASCNDCDFFVDDCRCTGVNGEELKGLTRCRKIGLKPGRMYSICRNNICDLFDNTKTLARIKGESQW